MSQRLSRAEQREYDRLREKARGIRTRDTGGSPRRARRGKEEEDDDGLFVLTGRHADSFIDRMFGSGQDEDDEDEDDEDEDDEDEDDDPAPPPANRFFRRR